MNKEAQKFIKDKEEEFLVKVALYCTCEGGVSGTGFACAKCHKQSCFGNNPNDKQVSFLRQALQEAMVMGVEGFRDSLRGTHVITAQRNGKLYTKDVNGRWVKISQLIGEINSIKETYIKELSDLETKKAEVIKEVNHA